ncbi:MAG: sugar phosphate isomerase/epimerase [Chloroflexi bacterium]|nr:sugar phosphate isomerase/epimerase [Chloroflexota bacterium]
MQLGIFSDVITGRDPEEVAAKTRALGFETVQLRLNVPGVDLSPEGISERDASRVRHAFESEGIGICALAAYTNLTHPDPERRRRNLDGFENRIRWARAFGTNVAATETGAFNRQSEWEADPYNDTEDAWREFLDILAPCVREAEAHDAVIALEAYVENVINTAARARAAVEHFGPAHVQIVMDPNNYFTPAMLERQDEVLHDVFAQVGDYIAIAHAKDVRPVPGQRKCALPRAGTGVLNWPLFVRLLRQTGFDGALVIEHLKEPEVEETRDFVRAQLAVAPAG